MSDQDKIDFAQKLNILFDQHKKSNGQPYTHEEVSKMTGITAGAISKLRRGQINNPSHKVIDALARFFSVSPNYFFGYGEGTTVNGMAVQKTPYINAISLRAAELSKGGQLALLGMLEEIIKLEEQFEEEEEKSEV